jgi:hypothetical protein
MFHKNIIMKHLAILVIVLILLGCSVNQISDNDIEVKAVNISQRLDSNSINIFREWGYGTRGDAEIWTKQSWDSSLYSCLFFKTDTCKLVIWLDDGFKNEFPYDFYIDSSKYYRTEFLKINDTSIRITAVDKNGKDHILLQRIPLKVLFKKNDPFQYFKSLSDFKDSLGIFGTFYRPDIGNFIQFFLSDQHVLTYLPDDLKISLNCKDIWLKKFATGKTIKKNWNLRKLDKPRDNR